MFNKNTIIAFVVIAIILFMMPKYNEWLNPEQARQDSLRAVAEQNATTSKKQNNIQKSTEDVEKNNLAKSQISESTTLDYTNISDNNSTAKSIVIKNKKYTLTLSNLGGGTIKQYVFHNYFTWNKKPIRLLKENGQTNLDVSYTNKYQEKIKFDDVPFHSNKFAEYENLDTVETDVPLYLEFNLTLKNGITITKYFTFYPEKYEIDLRVDIQNYRNKIPNSEYNLNWDTDFNITEKLEKSDLQYSYVYSKVGEELVELQLKKKPEKIKTDGSTKWVSLRSKYFTSVIIPTSKDGVSATISGVRDDKSRDFSASIAMRLPNANQHSDNFKIFVSPLDEDYLSSFNIGLEQMTIWGWKIIQPISIGIMWLLKFLHKFISNYGFVLLVFSVVIKLIVYPLTHKSYESMKKMQALQPKLTEIKEKYGNNKQQLNKKTMAMYKEYGVNPLGGCLPMLLQLPLLIALFNVFRTTIELRNEPFIWWIKDLSSPDIIFTLPFNIPMYGNTVAVLPFIMAGMMVIQQKLSGTSSTNPQQKYMMYFMPIFMLLIFNNFPSGLVLYYTLFNLLTILQQKYMINPSVEKSIKKKFGEIKTTSKKK
ncbi:MAG: membrane protein insertase YidC [Candidatus Marinimicrobia bacterium]|nr:membrane protein insertase YidC [Candidatus Neomarinimicrobiota bacterium]